VTANGSYFKNLDWLPAIGISGPERSMTLRIGGSYNLAARPEVPTLDDVKERGLQADGDRIAFEAVIGTQRNQIAVAPGTLRRTWTEAVAVISGMHVDAPIRNEYAFFSPTTRCVKGVGTMSPSKSFIIRHTRRTLIVFPKRAILAGLLHQALRSLSE
jgi:hypothetical protein